MTNWKDILKENNIRETLGESLPKEVERVQEIIRIYEETQGGYIAAGLMRVDVSRAQKAMIEGDIVEMLASYKDLKEWEM